MRKSKFSESQIEAIFKEADSGIPVADVLRNHGISAATFYKWRSKYGGLEASELKRIKELEQQVKDAPVLDALNTIIAKHGRWGFGLCFDRLRNQGYPWNHKKVWRVYKDMKLNIPRRTKKRLPKMPKHPLVAPTLPNHIWSLDFMHGVLYRGKPFRTLNVIDESNREALTIEIDFSLPAARVIRVLEQLEEIHGLPEAIRLDNGPELRSVVFTEWCESKRTKLKYIQPGKHQQNTFIERFNRTYRHKVLNAYLFDDLEQVREITEGWIRSYNEERSHRALGKLPPKSFRQQEENSLLPVSH